MRITLNKTNGTNTNMENSVFECSLVITSRNPSINIMDTTVDTAFENDPKFDPLFNLFSAGLVSSNTTLEIKAKIKTLADQRTKSSHEKLRIFAKYLIALIVTLK